MNRDDVTGSQPRASARLDPAVDLHLARLQQLLRVGTMLGEPGELEELADPDRLPGEGDIEDWRLGHPAHSAPARKAADAVVQPSLARRVQALLDLPFLLISGD